MEDLIEITEEAFGVSLDIRYATTNNVCARKLYSYPFCYLHKAMVGPLRIAIKSAKALGLKLKIFDGFRPIEVQNFMFNKFSANDADSGFVSNPKDGAVPHCRGVAIDLTLIDSQGLELDMGTDFDEFSNLASHNCLEVSPKAQQNRLTLLGLMTVAGFDFYAKEWWHYQLFRPRDYNIIRYPTSISISYNSVS